MDGKTQNKINELPNKQKTSVSRTVFVFSQQVEFMYIVHNYKTIDFNLLFKNGNTCRCSYSLVSFTVLSLHVQVYFTHTHTHTHTCTKIHHLPQRRQLERANFGDVLERLVDGSEFRRRSFISVAKVEEASVLHNSTCFVSLTDAPVDRVYGATSPHHTSAATHLHVCLYTVRFSNTENQIKH